MGKYRLPPAHARHTGGMTTNYLEAVEAESDYEDDGLTASDRARRSLHRDRYDEEAEVLLQFLPFSSGLQPCCVPMLGVHWLWGGVCSRITSMTTVAMQHQQHVACMLIIITGF